MAEPYRGPYISETLEEVLLLTLNPEIRTLVRRALDLNTKQQALVRLLQQHCGYGCTMAEHIKLLDELAQIRASVTEQPEVSPSNNT